MLELEKIVRKNILELSPYSCARNEFNGTQGVFLDANESPFGELNRYPDPIQSKLKDALSKIKKISSESIFIGNGSDEIIDLILRIFCSPGKDKVIVCPPTYGMYEVCANINNVEIVRIPLSNQFQLNVKEILNTQAKLIFLCSPNNPTGNSLMDIEKVLADFPGIVVVDEAYIDFSERESLIAKLSMHPNLIVVQTLSKAWGLAGGRIGIAYCSPQICKLLLKIKPPYNVSDLNQKVALKVLNKKSVVQINILTLLEEKRKVVKELENLSIVKRVYPSDANFVLVNCQNGNEVYDFLIEKKIITRNRNSEISNCLRITIGCQEENTKLINALKSFSK